MLSQSLEHWGVTRHGYLAFRPPVFLATGLRPVRTLGASWRGKPEQESGARKRLEGALAQRKGA